MNFFKVVNARPLSSDSLAMAIHSSIVFSGQTTWMAKAELITTTFFWASVAVLFMMLSKIFAASSGVCPPSKSVSL